MRAPRIHHGLAHRLILTPHLRQRIDMLAMTKLELRELLAQELQENPVLEEVTEVIPTAEAALRSTEKDEYVVPPLRGGSC